MKCIKYCVALLGLLMGTSSCDSFFDKPTNVQDLDYVFGNGSTTLSWLAHGYSLIPSPLMMTLTSSVDYAPDWWEFSSPYELISDEADINDNRDCYKAYRITRGDWSVSGSGFGEKWIPLYRVIRHLYVFLDNVHVVPQQTDINTQEKVDKLKLQARFLIAYYHVLLFEQFGPIPIVKSAVDPGASEESFLVSRNSVDEVVNWLDEELLTLANQLPTSYEDAWGAAPTQASALAVRARLLLYAASPLFNSPDNYSGLKEFANLANKDGKKLFPQSYDPEKWKRAADAAKLLIDTQGGRYDLVGATAEGSPNSFEDAYAYYRQVFNDPFNKEALFSRSPAIYDDFSEYLQVATPLQYMARLTGSNGGAVLGVTQKLVDTYYMDNGTEATADNPYYVEEGFTTDPEKITVNRVVSAPSEQQQDVYKIDRVYNMYQNREARFYVSVFFNGRKWESQLVTNEKGEVDPVDFSSRSDVPTSGGRTSFYPKTGYTPYKFIDAEDTKPTHKQKRPILYRWAEVYLNYAEALNQYDPGNPDILRYLNKVRNRAGLPNYEEVFPERSSQAEIHKAIMRERNIEFAWEGLRYFDTRRYLVAETEDNGPFYGMDPSALTEADFYKRTKFVDRVFKKQFYLYPIPQEEINKNANLVQNPYWR